MSVKEDVINHIEKFAPPDTNVSGRFYCNGAGNTYKLGVNEGWQDVGASYSITFLGDPEWENILSFVACVHLRNGKCIHPNRAPRESKCNRQGDHRVLSISDADDVLNSHL